ncbi:hypothetical protein [Neobacillus sp. FSL H8-0543]|uniref:hypothetical protein n=1 Tax=Neobacillus sp. FSL H8-0543 TaxID=2954672 RepID=UPI0031584207
MKRFLMVLLGLLTIYVIYIDLTNGTLPNSYTQKSEIVVATTASTKTSLPAFEKEVQPGETVISIIEHQLDKPLPISIDELIQDFRKLNPGQAPEKIQIGSTYQFPDYSK